MLGLGEVVSVMLERQHSRDTWRGADTIDRMPTCPNDRVTYMNFNVCTEVPESVMEAYGSSRK